MLDTLKAIVQHRQVGQEDWRPLASTFATGVVGSCAASAALKAATTLSKSWTVAIRGTPAAAAIPAISLPRIAMRSPHGA